MGTHIYNPYSTTTVGGETIHNLFRGNVIPVTMLDPAVAKLTTIMPALTSSASINYYNFNGTLRQQTDQFDVRIDQHVGVSDHLVVHHGYDKNDFITAGSIPSPVHSATPVGPYFAAANPLSRSMEPLFNQSITLGYTKVLGANTVAKSHLAMVCWQAQITRPSAAFDTAAALGIPNINININHLSRIPTKLCDDGKCVGVAVLDHPLTHWHNTRFLFTLDPCITTFGPIIIHPAAPPVLRYRIVVRDGPAPNEVLQKLSGEWREMMENPFVHQDRAAPKPSKPKDIE